MMRFALNYSPQAAQLVKSGQIDVDLFKCPNWPDMVAEARTLRPVYIHFGLQVGAGRGQASTNGDKGPVDWAEIEDWLSKTGTGAVNLHLEATTTQHPGIPFNSTATEHADALAEAYYRDVTAVTSRFGADRVIVENNHANNAKALAAGVLPAPIRAVVEQTGCGFLFDLSHARLAARRLGLDEQVYIAQLPLEHTHEIHITGIQRFGSPWDGRMRANGVAEERIARYQGRWLDHLPLTAIDWEVMAWAAEKVKLGRWGEPRILAVECGGAGPIWQALTDADALAEQIPRLRALFG